MEGTPRWSPYKGYTHVYKVVDHLLCQFYLSGKVYENHQGEIGSQGMYHWALFLKLRIYQNVFNDIAQTFKFIPYRIDVQMSNNDLVCVLNF